VGAEPPRRRVWRPPFALDVRVTLSDLQHGRFDPCHRVDGAGTVWRTSLLPSGGVTYRLWQVHGEVHADAWGPGAEELLEGLTGLLGDGDHPETFEPVEPALARANHRLHGFRVPRTGRLLEALLPAILEQRVVGLDASTAWRRLVQRLGDPPPGPAPAGMRLPPSPQQWSALPSWEWLRAGVDEHRMRAAMASLTLAPSLERAVARAGPDADPEPVYRRLRSIPGVGVWTAAQVGQRALGDADALPLGDYHLADLAGYAFLGRSLTDEEIEPYFEHWRPHRYRVVRILELYPFTRRPRRGPRRPLQRPAGG
jgi:3-methyladenine DNA glycosylase/8-oxoguanine DNA glycosylase